MRSLIFIALVIAFSGCGSSGGGGSATAVAVDITVTVGDVANPHGYWIVRSLNTWGGSHERTMVLSFLHDGEQQAITAVPESGYKVIWHGTDNDASTALTNTFTAAAGLTVTVEFVPII